MSATRPNRIDQLEAEVAELRALVGGRRRRRIRRGPLRRLALIGLMLALVIPAGVVLGGGQTFTDVPPSHKFFGSIEAIAAAGITSGCNATQYCPNGLVTRGQMAAFLNRLGALEAGSQPKVNADKLDGFDSSAFSRAAYATVRPDQCFLAPGNRCTLTDAKNIGHIRKVTTGVYCVAPADGVSFAGRTPSFSYGSGTNLAAGAPIIIFGTPGSCAPGEIQVQTWSWISTSNFTLSEFVGFGIVIP